MPADFADSATFHQRARREQLVGVALELIGGEGLDALSVSAVARRAGVSRGVIAYNVGDLEDLVDGVVALVYERGRTSVRPGIDAAADPAAGLRVFVAASLDFYAEHRTEMRALREIFARRDRPREASAEAAREHDETTDLLRAGQRHGFFVDADPDLLADAVRAVLDVAAARIARGDDADRLRAEVGSAIDRLVGLRDPGGV